MKFAKSEDSAPHGKPPPFPDDKDVPWQLEMDNVQGSSCEIPVCAGSRSTNHKVWSVSRCPRTEHWRCGSTSRCPFLP